MPSNSCTDSKEVHDFPLKIKSKRRDDTDNKLDIKDVIEELVHIGHGSPCSKKQLIDLFKNKF